MIIITESVLLNILRLSSGNSMEPEYSNILTKNSTFTGENLPRYAIVDNNVLYISYSGNISGYIEKLREDSNVYTIKESTYGSLVSQITNAVNSAIDKRNITVELI